MKIVCSQSQLLFVPHRFTLPSSLAAATFRSSTSYHSHYQFSRRSVTENTNRSVQLQHSHHRRIRRTAIYKLATKARSRSGRRSRRAPVAAHTVKGRLPLGTLRQSDGLSHSHIRVVPHADCDTTRESIKECGDRTPTFHSPSLQFPSPFDSKARSAAGFQTEPLTQAKTFAGMARRFHQKEAEDDSDQSTPGSVSLAGIIKFQSSRNKMSRTWRPVRASDLEESDNASCDARHILSTAGGLLPSSTFITSPMESRNVQSTKASPALELKGELSDQTNNYGTPIELSQVGDIRICPKISSSLAGNHCEQLFGKLPDPISLHEEMGEFDGQVVFIGHPNRDVSAHQWSSASFQWVNIGRYAHSRGKVEGSLASDLLKEDRVSHDPLGLFKLAAENREKIVVEDGLSKEVPARIHRSAPAGGARTDLLSTASDSTSEHFQTARHDSSRSNFLPLEKNERKTSIALQASVGVERLEDPFVAPTRPSSFRVGSRHQYRRDMVGPKGSLDLEYEFPFKSTMSTMSELDYSIDSASQKLILGGGKNYHETYTVIADRLSQPTLRDTNFGGDATGGLVTSSGRSFVPPRAPFTFTPEDIRDHQKSTNRLTELGDQTTRLSAPAQRGIESPAYACIQPTARSMFPPPGLTVANPHRIASSLNASVPIYANVRKLAPGPNGSASEATTVNAITAALRFSDPDGLQLTQEHEIANGLGQQIPTLQSFKGPFFTDSKPTTSDPTVSLSVRIGEEEKLLNWFRDGHRPSRQQEYAKTLISTAVPSSRIRSGGEVSDAQTSRLYENTSPFVRLYESLSEYFEEYRNESGRAYFTRAWKHAPPRLRDLGPEGNNSYFNRPTGSLADTKTTTE